MEKIRTVINDKPLKELFHNTFILSLVAFIFSLVLASLYVTFSVTDEEWIETGRIILVILSGILMFLSLFLFVTCKKSIVKNRDFIREVEYDFQEDGLAFEVFRNHERIEGGKLRYQDLLDYKETKNYVFVRIGNNTCFIIDKVDGLIDFLESKNIKKFKSRKPRKK